MPSATKKVSLVRRSEGHYTATNARGGQIRFGSGQDAEFTPVELLLAAIGGCSSVDVDTVTSRRGGPTQFTVSVMGTKVSDEEGRASLGDVSVGPAIVCQQEMRSRSQAIMLSSASFAWGKARVKLWVAWAIPGIVVSCTGTPAASSLCCHAKESSRSGSTSQLSKNVGGRPVASSRQIGLLHGSSRLAP